MSLYQLSTKERLLWLDFECQPEQRHVFTSGKELNSTQFEILVPRYAYLQQEDIQNLNLGLRGR
jgi:hypothetical protein